MNMYEFAKEMEDDAEQLYRDLASKATTVGVKTIFTMLADDEALHGKVVEILKGKNGSKDLDESFLPRVTTVFEEIRQNMENIELSTDQLKDYKIALEIEKKGFQFYKDQLEQPGDEQAMKLLKSLANQELYHIKTIENLIEMLEKPLWWVENAEFTPKDSDYL